MDRCILCGESLQITDNEYCPICDENRLEETSFKLDDFTLNHLNAWLENQYLYISDQDEVRQNILKLLESDPDLLNNHSWPELRMMAERY